jgi:hypothetical protein
MADLILPETAVPAKRRGRRTHAEMVEQRRQIYLARKAEEDAAFQTYLDTMPLDRGVCYFFGAAEGVVKIGFSKNIMQRFNRINSSSLYHLEILALAPGSDCRERHYHNRFQPHSIGREWFKRCPEIEAEIASLNERFPVNDMLIALGCHEQDFQDAALIARLVERSEAA